LVIGLLTAITALTPPQDIGVMFHAPPVDIRQTSRQPYYPEEIEEAKEVPEIVEDSPETHALPVFVAMPAALPLDPHVDTMGFFYLEEIPLSYELQRYVFYRSAALGLEYELVLALMWRESSFRIEAVNLNRNGTRDTGLMQINDVNRGWLEERYGIYNLMDPIQNINAGTFILADLLSRYEERQALVAYQFGESGMLRMVRDGADINALTIRVREKRYEYRIMRAEVYNNM